jgi:hypothetical protein
MKKTLTAIVAASALAAAGLAQADAIYYPDGTRRRTGRQLGRDAGAGRLVHHRGHHGARCLGRPGHRHTIDTTVMGAAPLSASTTTTVQVPQLVYVQPNINFDRATVLSQLHNRDLVVRDHRVVSVADTRDTFNVPQRAGEASTMTGGAPNLVTDNHIVVGGLTIPHTVVSVDQPYYVMSF